MDRRAIARARRRRQALESLEFEREREAALADQLEDMVAEAEGPRIDEQAFAAMEKGDVALVRQALAPSFLEPDEEPFFFERDSLDTEQDSVEDEIARLKEEIAASRRTQQALERYVAALDGGEASPPAARAGDETG